MANEADSKERKRRRRKGGLRVPSDNVPRRASQADSGGVVDEAIENETSSDPRLAVSLASAFGATDGGEDLDDAIEGEPIEEYDDDEDFETESESEAEIEVEPVRDRTPPPPPPPAPARPPAPAPAVDIGPIAMASSRAESTGDSVDIAFDDEDDDEPAPPKSPPQPPPTNGAASDAVARPVDDEQVARALEGTIEDVSAEVEMLPDGPRTDEHEAVEPPADLVEDEDVSIDDRATSLMPAISEDDVAEVEAAVEDEGEDEGEDGQETIKGQPALDAQAIGGRVVPGDSSDSGELLTDDLIEEFDSGSISKPESPLPAPVVPDEDAEPLGAGAARESRAATILEPVEELAASDVVEVDGQQGEPESAAPPAEPPAPPAEPPAPPAEPPATPPPPRPAAPVTVRPKPPPAPPPSAAAAAAAAAAAQPRPAPRRKGKPWFEEIFDEDYLRTLPFLTPRETQKQAVFVVESLGIEPGASVLDIGCGYGRHAMELAARGFHVVGLDASLPLLIRGADEAQRRGLTINFVHGDMRELTFEQQFDGAYCLFGTFGYFDDETNKKAAQAVARALKPGGRFVVEVLNRDYLIADLPSRVWWEGDGCVVLEEVEFNYFSSRIVSNRSVVFDDGRQLEQEISLRAYSLHELGKLLHAAGFRILEISGSIDTKGRFFGADSREIVVVCEKRSATPDNGSGGGSSNGSGNGLGDGHTGTTPGTGE